MTVSAAQQARQDIREGRHNGPTRGVAPGFVQCNLVIVRKALAYDFLVYCQRNAKACPVLEVTDPGDCEPRRIAPGADLRTDLPRYVVFRNGRRQRDEPNLLHLWEADFVGFLIGSGITFDQALERAGVPTHEHRWVIRTAMPTVASGPFSGPLIATMRLLTPAQAIIATQVTSRFPFNHGAPIHIGDPAVIGADLDHPLHGPHPCAIPEGLVACFWACGVTPQAAAESSGIDLLIAHAPAHGFISDLRADQICLP